MYEGPHFQRSKSISTSDSGVVCLGEGGHKNLGGRTLTQLKPDKFGIRQRSGEYFAPNPMLSFFGMDFALKFGGEDQKNKEKVFLAKS